MLVVKSQNTIIFRNFLLTLSLEGNAAIEMRLKLLLYFLLKPETNCGKYVNVHIWSSAESKCFMFYSSVMQFDNSGMMSLIFASV